MPQSVAGIVLAGGYSSRMGMNKALLTYRGQPLYQHMMCLLQASGVSAVYVSGEVPNVATCLPDREPHAGPACAVANLMARFSGVHRRLLVVPVDMPLLTIDVLQMLLAPPSGAYYSHYPLPLCVNTGVLAKPVRSVRDLITHCQIEALSLPDVWQSAMRNFNTPEEWADCGG